MTLLDAGAQTPEVSPELKRLIERPPRIRYECRLVQLRRNGLAPMNTLFLLMAQYDARAIIPVEAVCRDYFTHLSPEKFLRKVSDGEIRLPIVRMEASQKSARGVHLADLAAYLDKRHAAALREAKALFG